MQRLVKAAIANGATNAKIIHAHDVCVDRRSRLKCLVPRCSSYGRHLLCPPNLMSVDDFEAILDCYRSGLLLQIETNVDSSDKSSKHLDADICEAMDSATDSREWQLKLLRLVNTTEAIAFKMGFYFAAGLTGGECCLCRECVTPQSGRPCRHPFQSRPSMEAMGIDVISTCGKAEMPVFLSSKKTVRWTGLVLLD